MLTTFSGRRPSQHEAELSAFIALLLERGVTSYLEIGAREGDTFHAVMCALPKGSCGVAVDMPGGLWGKDSTRLQLPCAVEDLIARGYGARHVFGDSQTTNLRDLVQLWGPYDAILIDGDHTLAGVTRDWELYGEMAPLVAFHDIVGTDQIEKVHGKPVEVPIIWEAIKAEGAEVLEFVGAGSTMGIGVVLR